MIVQLSTLNFLKRLVKNNHREWFLAHKSEYQDALQNVQQFIDALIEKMNEHDQIETPSAKKSLYRIYNDVRFTDDKTPYNPRFAGHLKRLKPHQRGGYYYWIAPGRSRIGCGFTYPSGEDLKRIRVDIAQNLSDWTNLLNTKSIRNNFGNMQGEQVATAPKGYAKDHPAIALLRYKQYWFEHNFTDDEVLSNNFLLTMNQKFKAIRPFFDYMSDVLSTNVNGETIL